MTQQKRLTQSAKKALFMFQKMGFTSPLEGKTTSNNHYVSLDQCRGENGLSSKRALFVDVDAAEKSIFCGTYAVGFGANRNKAFTALGRAFETKATGNICLAVVSGTAGDLTGYKCYQSSLGKSPKMILSHEPGS